MKREEAKNIIQDCLEEGYDTGKYEKLIANILTIPYKKMSHKLEGNSIREAFRDSINSYTILGIYEDVEKKKKNQHKLLKLRKMKLLLQLQ